MSLKTTIREFFKTNLKPTQAQFSSFFDSIRWIDEKVPVADIEGIQDIFDAKAEQSVLDAVLIELDAHSKGFNKKEDKSNKKTDLTSPDPNAYPTVLAVKDAINAPKNTKVFDIAKLALNDTGVVRLYIAPLGFVGVVNVKLNSSWDGHNAQGLIDVDFAIGSTYSYIWSKSFKINSAFGAITSMFYSDFELFADANGLFINIVKKLPSQDPLYATITASSSLVNITYTPNFSDFIVETVPQLTVVSEDMPRAGGVFTGEVTVLSATNPTNPVRLSQVYTKPEALDLFVGKIGVQDIFDTKTFKASPVIPNATLDKHAVNLAQVKEMLPKAYSTLVYVNSNSPLTATIFDTENPPVTNNNALKNNVNNLYIGANSSTWVYDGITYKSQEMPDTSNFYIERTQIPAGNEKNYPIERAGSIKTSRFIKKNPTYTNGLLVANGTDISPLSLPVSTATRVELDKNRMLAQSYVYLSATSDTASISVFTYLMPAGTLSKKGDILEIEVVGSAGTGGGRCSILMGGRNVAGGDLDSGRYYSVKSKITRTSATTVSVFRQSEVNGSYFFETYMDNMDSEGILFDFQTISTIAGAKTALNSITIEKKSGV